MEKALFVGNGIHRVFPENAISWDDLLMKLAESNELRRIMPKIANTNLSNPLKPFPLAFEELLHRGNHDGEDADFKLMMVKEEIAKLFESQELKGKRVFNEFHRSFMNSNCTDVITTNYDYGFQLSIMDQFKQNKTQYANYKLEKTANLRRSYSIEKKNVWHMHGELEDSRDHKKPSVKDYSAQSILIGYDHYSKNLTDIKSYLDGTYNKDIGYIIDRITYDQDLNISWIDKFFTHNIDIIGVGLGFEEQDLWWLLNYRAQKKKGNSRRKKAKIENTIRFFVRKKGNVDVEELDYKTRLRLDKNNAIKEVLEAMDVKVVELDVNDYPELYRNYIKKYLND